MIKHFLYFIAASFLVTMLMSQSLYAQNRMEVKRLNSITFHGSYSSVEESSNSLISTLFYYRSDEPELIDSVVIHSEINHSGNVTTTNTTVNYEGTKSFENGFYHYDYTTDTGNNYHLIRDVSHRLISNSITLADGEFHQYYRYYNQNSRLDSLIVTNVAPHGPDFTKFILAYYPEELKPAVIYRQTIYDGVVTSTITSMCSYPEGFPLNPAYLKWDEIAPFGDSFIEKEVYLNPTYQVYGGIYELVNGWYQISWCYTGIYNPVYRFDLNGNFIYYHDEEYSGSTDVSEETTYYVWDTIVLNDDNETPQPNITLSAYPNPFRDNLTINTNMKNKPTADISIYNIKGQLIRQWKDSKASELVWNGKDMSNHPVSSGIYLIKSRQGNHTSTAKVIKL